MSLLQKNFKFFVFAALFASVIAILSLRFYKSQENKSQNSKIKLYWFIPDGLRAEPDLFKIYEWARSGELPNLNKLIQRGSYGYSIPVFPSHTPVNFAALLTGALPKSNGVSDGPMHTEGNPLNKVSVGGFRSSARRVPSIWTMLEKVDKKVFVLSVPGSTPPEIERGIVVRGRWGGWGPDTYSLVYEASKSEASQNAPKRSEKFFNFGPP